MNEKIEVGSLAKAKIETNKEEIVIILKIDKDVDIFKDMSLLKMAEVVTSSGNTTWVFTHNLKNL